MIYDLHDARQPVAKGRLRRRAAMVRLGGREAMDMASWDGASATGTAGVDRSIRCVNGLRIRFAHSTP
eukprot:COSAG02_NODE_617_length_19476_cov_158.404913_12_plen_68_part_00